MAKVFNKTLIKGTNSAIFKNCGLFISNYPYFELHVIIVYKYSTLYWLFQGSSWITALIIGPKNLADEIPHKISCAFYSRAGKLSQSSVERHADSRDINMSSSNEANKSSRISFTYLFRPFIFNPYTQVIS